MPRGVDSATPFGALDFSQRLSVVAAVSGGGDSLALLLLLKSWLEGLDRGVRLLAVTVNHGLRAEAAAEAGMVAELCGRLGIEHRIMRWTGPKPPTGVIAAARDARHRLLAEAARDAGTDLVVTGHTLNDQAETVAMRRDRRAEGEGLSGIAPATLYDGSVWFARPLIGMRREALRDVLRGRGVGWIDDPTNEDLTFERARVRASLSAAEIERLADEALRAGAARAALSTRAAALIDRHATRPAPGLFRLDTALFTLGLSTDDVDAAVLALRAVLAVAGGTSHLPDLPRSRGLFERIARGAVRATLSRTVIDVRRSGVWVRREARSLPRLVLSRKPTPWDGRWLVTAQQTGDLTVRPSGGSVAAVSPKAGDVPQSLERAALSAEPALFEGEAVLGLVWDPLLATRGVQASPIVAPYATYLPSFDLRLAKALRRLIDLPPLPAPPWKDHIDAEA